MYLQHELRQVTEHRQTEGLARIHWLHSLMQPQPGFIRTLACRYLGSLTQYAWLRMWNSSEEQTAFRQTDGAKQFASTRPDGLYGPLPGGIGAGVHWESVLENQVGEGGSYLIRRVFSVAEDRAAEFVEGRRQHDALALKDARIKSVLTFRCVEAGSEPIYVCLIRADARDAYNEFVESDAAAPFRDGPDRPWRTLITECYEIVEELTAPA